MYVCKYIWRSYSAMEHSMDWITQFPYCTPLHPLGLTSYLYTRLGWNNWSIPFLLWYSTFLDIFITFISEKNGTFFPQKLFSISNISSGQKNSSASVLSHIFFFDTINMFKESLPLGFTIGLFISSAGSQLSLLGKWGQPLRGTEFTLQTWLYPRCSLGINSELVSMYTVTAEFLYSSSLPSLGEEMMQRGLWDRAVLLKLPCPSTHQHWSQLHVSCQTWWAQFPYHFPGLWKKLSRATNRTVES